MTNRVIKSFLLAYFVVGTTVVAAFGGLIIY